MKYKNDLILRVANGEPVLRPPVWLMRQAGRILPQYRKVRESVAGFKALVQNPKLAAEVTLQPVAELGVDAAIIFSDILVIPEAMGLPYELIEKKGPRFPKTIQSLAQVKELESGSRAAHRLDYVFEAVHFTNQRLDAEVPLIGFSGAPWTLLSYMVEGGGSKTFSQAKRFLYTQPEVAHLLLEKLTDTIIAYLKLKIEAGVALVQIFDSWAGILSPEQYQRFSLPYLQRICKAIDEVPVIVFAKGAWFALAEINELECEIIGLDWNVSPQWARNLLGPERTLQGNLDPCCLYGSKATIKAQTLAMIEAFDSRHIVNLGHGVYPDTPLENVKTFVNCVKNFHYQAVTS